MSSLVQGILGSYARVPFAPTIGTATATGETTASITFTAPINNGGRNIVSYTAVSSPGNITATVNQSGSGTINITGLTASTTYTFVVYATNALGNSSNSSSSNQITTSSGSLSYAAFVVAVGGGGGGGAAHQAAGGGGGGGGVNQDANFAVYGGCQYCISIGAGGARGIGSCAPSQIGGHATDGTGSCFYSLTDPQSVLADGGGRGAGSRVYSCSPQPTAPVGYRVNLQYADGGSSCLGGGGGEARHSTATPVNQPLGWRYGDSTYGGRGGGTWGPGSIAVGGVSSGGGGGAGGQGEDGVSVWASTCPGGWDPATYPTPWRAINNKGGNGGAGITVCDGTLNYGYYGGGGGGGRVAWSPGPNVPICGADAGAGATGPCCWWEVPGCCLTAGGGGGRRIYTPATAICIAAPNHQSPYTAAPGNPLGSNNSGGGGGGGVHEATSASGTCPIGDNRWRHWSPTCSNPTSSPSYGWASGTGGSGVVIFAYPSDKPDITSISPTLTWSRYTINGRKFYMFKAGAGTITI